MISVENERALIGCILIDPTAGMYACAKHGVVIDSFTDPSSRELFRAFQDMRAKGKDINSVSVGDYCSVKSDKIIKIIDETPTASHVDYHAQRVKEKHNARMIVASAKQTIDMLDNGSDLPIAVDGLYSTIVKVTSSTGVEILQPCDALEDTKDRWERAARGEVVGIPFNVAPTVNKCLGGWRRGCMSIIGAYRACGKSTIIRQDAIENAKRGNNVLLFSLEDPKDIALSRMAGYVAGESIFELDKGNSAQLTKVVDAWETMRELPIRVVANPCSIAEIMSIAEMVNARYKLDIIYIDHIQYVYPLILPSMSRNDTMAHYSQCIVNMAKRLDIAAVCASQFSRASEKESRKPRLSDLRDSGSLEQDARQIILLYWDAEADSFMLEVAKNNYGQSGEAVEVIRYGDMQRFEERRHDGF